MFRMDLDGLLGSLPCSGLKGVRVDWLNALFMQSG